MKDRMEIVASHQELRCPECRVLVEVRIDELPPNVLLMRILEGKSSNGQGTADGQAQHSHHPSHPQQHHHHPHQPLSRIIASSGVTGTGPNASLDLSKIPHAKAFYDFSSSETSDISFRKGDIIILRKKIDHNWCVGEVNGKEGAVPLNHIKVIVPLPFPQCKALYDFRMGPTEEEGCLTFKKGALIHVLRRVDQNWAEGRIGDKIGIFPISSATSSSDTSSSVTTSPNSSTSTTSSNSSTAPSSPTAHFLQQQSQPAAVAGSKQHQSKRSDPANREKRHSLTTSGLSTTTTATGGPLQPSQAAPHRHSTEMLNTEAAAAAGDAKPSRQSVDAATAAAAAPTTSTATATAYQKSVTQQKLNTEAAAAAGDAKPSRQSVDAATAAAAAPTTSTATATAYQKCNATKASQMYQQHPQLPTMYVALYPYKPQKPDELELKKGGELCVDIGFR
uniref:SH3 domain-containing protein n=1 Tax=Anopheles melas TaxID=34690 RepID=A0A182TNA5_9DIPT